MKPPCEITEAARAAAMAVLDPSVIFGFDRVTIWFDRPEVPFELSKIEEHCAKVKDYLEQMPQQARWKLRLEIFQPTIKCLQILADELGCATAVLINYVEIACDLPSGTRRQIRARRNRFLESAKMLHLPHDVVRDKKYGTIFYYGGRRSPSVLAVYADKPSKLNNARPPDGGAPCAHQEFRKTGEGAVTDCGIVGVDDLADFDHAKFWDQNLRFYKIPTNKTQLGRLLARAFGADPNVSGSALRKRALRWVKKHSIVDGRSEVFVMHNALRATPNLEKLLPQISFKDWLDEVLAL